MVMYEHFTNLIKYLLLEIMADLTKQVNRIVERPILGYRYVNICFDDNNERIEIHIRYYN